MTEHLARLIDVSRYYGSTVALDHVDLDVAAGTTLGLLGPNGAGKSTLLHLLVGLRRPSTGRVELFGGSPTDASRRRHLGMTPQQTGLPDTLRVREFTDFVARHYHSPVPSGEILEQFGLSDLERRQAGSLSGGQQRRLAVALAFIGRPRLVLLDEPTTGLDVEARKALWEGVREHAAKGGTIVLTSHYLEEIEALAERIVVLGAGGIVADGDLDSIKASVTMQEVRFTAPGLPELPGIEHHEQTGDLHTIRTGDSDQFVRELIHSGVEFTHLEVRRPTLEDAFLKIDGSTSAAA
ncbi:ABC transporter ATP-binding protein [Nocardiopsis sp. NPDC006832]|uniref:ABC transporter ATP-binding protein n=1 Tax=Nocardiopsis sp. NPDC006832 TaxID=3157188 RepID=UPI00340AD4FE